jgi:hypothetical protein
LIPDRCGLSQFSSENRNLLSGRKIERTATTLWWCTIKLSKPRPNTNQNGFFVQTFCKIIVESSNGRWSAWFRDVPEIFISGSRPADAIRQLICHFGEDQFGTTEIFSLPDAAHDGHLEYMIPLRNQQRIPIPSSECHSFDISAQ